MKKTYLFAVIPFVLSIGCFVAFNMIGSYVAEDGTLIEPFWLIPIGYLMLAISIVASLTLGMKFLLKMKKFSYKNTALVIGLVIVIGFISFVTYPRYFNKEALIESTPSREADAGCKWEKKIGAGLEFWGAYCDYGDKKYHTVINGTEVSVEEITENGPVTIKNVIQVFSLAGNKIEDVIPFLQIQSRRPWNIADKCAFIKDDQNSTTEVAKFILKPTGDSLVKMEQDCKTGPVLDSCAGYGMACSGVRYFEIHNSNPSKAIFVEYGQEPPMFDEKTIRVK